MSILPWLGVSNKYDPKIKPLCYTTNSDQSTDSYLLDVAYQFHSGHLVCAWYLLDVLDNHLTSIAKQVSSICQLLDICLIITCKILCAVWQVIVKYLASKCQALAKRRARN